MTAFKLPSISPAVVDEIRFHLYGTSARSTWLVIKKTEVGYRESGHGRTLSDEKGKPANFGQSGTTRLEKTASVREIGDQTKEV